jgi:hypothetical protein
MTASNAITLERNVIAPKIVNSRIKVDRLVVNVKSIFDGDVKIGDVLYKIAVNKIHNKN